MGGALLVVVLLVGSQIEWRPQDLSAPPLAPAPPPAPVQQPEQEVAALLMLLDFSADSWFELRVDGEVIEQGVVIPGGTTLEVAADDELVLRFGNAGGVNLTLNGRDFGPAGGSREVLRLTFTASDVDAVR